MKIFLMLLFLVPALSFADSSSCHSEDGRVSLFVVSGGGEVSFFDIHESIELPELEGEVLPKGRYEHGQDVNEQLNWYFEEYAWLQLEGKEGQSGKATLTLWGQHDSAPQMIVFKSDLNCFGDAF